MPCRKYVVFASSSFVRRRPNIYCKAVSHSRCKRVFTIHDCLEPTTSLPRPPPIKEHSFEIKTSTKTHGLHVVACSNARRYMNNYFVVLSGSTEDAPTSMYMYAWYANFIWSCMYVFADLGDGDGLLGAGEDGGDADRAQLVAEVVRLEARGRSRARHKLLGDLRTYVCTSMNAQPRET